MPKYLIFVCSYIYEEINVFLPFENKTNHFSEESRIIIDNHVGTNGSVIENVKSVI